MKSFFRQIYSFVTIIARVTLLANIAGTARGIITDATILTRDNATILLLGDTHRAFGEYDELHQQIDVSTSFQQPPFYLPPHLEGDHELIAYDSMVATQREDLVTLLKELTSHSPAIVLLEDPASGSMPLGCNPFLLPALCLGYANQITEASSYDHGDLLPNTLGHLRAHIAQLPAELRNIDIRCGLEYYAPCIHIFRDFCILDTQLPLTQKNDLLQHVLATSIRTLCNNSQMLQWKQAFKEALTRINTRYNSPETNTLISQFITNATRQLSTEAAETIEQLCQLKEPLTNIVLQLMCAAIDPPTPIDDRTTDLITRLRELNNQLFLILSNLLDMEMIATISEEALQQQPRLIVCATGCAHARRTRNILCERFDFSEDSAQATQAKNSWLKKLLMPASRMIYRATIKPAEPPV